MLSTIYLNDDDLQELIIKLENNPQISDEYIWYAFKKSLYFMNYECAEAINKYLINNRTDGFQYLINKHIFQHLCEERYGTRRDLVDKDFVNRIIYPRYLILDDLFHKYNIMTIYEMSKFLEKKTILEIFKYNFESFHYYTNIDKIIDIFAILGNILLVEEIFNLCEYDLQENLPNTCAFLFYHGHDVDDRLSYESFVRIFRILCDKYEYSDYEESVYIRIKNIEFDYHFELPKINKELESRRDLYLEYKRELYLESKKSLKYIIPDCIINIIIEY